MVSAVLLVIWIGLIIYQIYKWMTYKPPNFPPGKRNDLNFALKFWIQNLFVGLLGPPRLPIFGTYPLLLLINYKHLHRAVDWLCKYYKTDVLGLYAASYATVIGNSNAAARELLNDPKLDGKPDLKLAQIRDPEFVSRGRGNGFYDTTFLWLPNYCILHIVFRNFLYRRSSLVWTASIFTAIHERFWIWSPSRWTRKWNSRWNFGFNGLTEKWTQIWIWKGFARYKIPGSYTNNLNTWEIFIAYRHIVMKTVQSFRIYSL